MEEETKSLAVRQQKTIDGQERPNMSHLELLAATGRCYAAWHDYLSRLSQCPICGGVK